MRECPPAVPPSAAQKHGALGPPAQGRRSAPRCAAEPTPAAAPQATVLAARRLVHHPRPPRCPSQNTVHQPPGGGHAPERGSVVQLAVPPPALAIVCLRGAVWWVISARAIPTLRRSCRSHCLSRRCRLLAAPDALASRTDANMKSQLRSNAKNKGHARAETCVVPYSSAIPKRPEQ